MPRKSKYISLIFLLFGLLVFQPAIGQRWKLLRYQVGAGVGTTQIFGDIGGTADKENWFGIKDISFDETKMAYGVFARYKVNSLFSVKANFNYGKGQGTDENSRNDRGRSYKANLYEFSGQFEYYFLSEEPRHRSSAWFDKKGMVNNYSTLSAYLFAGFGVGYSTLSHNFGSTVGPYDDYRSSNIAPVVPFGIGAKFVLDEKWTIEGDLGYRWAINDYVEGYKQTSASKFNDIYYFLMFSVSYRLETSRRGIPGFLDRKHKKYGY